MRLTDVPIKNPRHLWVCETSQRVIERCERAPHAEEKRRRRRRKRRRRRRGMCEAGGGELMSWFGCSSWDVLFRWKCSDFALRRKVTLGSEWWKGRDFVFALFFIEEVRFLQMEGRIPIRESVSMIRMSVCTHAYMHPLNGALWGIGFHRERGQRGCVFIVRVSWKSLLLFGELWIKRKREREREREREKEKDLHDGSILQSHWKWWECPNHLKIEAFNWENHTATHNEEDNLSGFHPASCQLWVWLLDLLFENNSEESVNSTKWRDDLLGSPVEIGGPRS